jgi:ribosomal protein L12E/L44/L45/RPP1/RPP2
MTEAPTNGPENAPTNNGGEGDKGTQTNANAKNVSELPEWAQAELSRARNDAASYRTRLRETEQARDDLKSSLEAETTKVSELQTQVDDFKLTSAKFDAALDAYGVEGKQVKAFAGRLQGSTADELVADAKSLMETLGGPLGNTKPRATDKSAGLGNDKPPTGEDAFAEAVARSLGWDK